MEIKRDWEGHNGDSTRQLSGTAGCRVRIVRKLPVTTLSLSHFQCIKASKGAFLPSLAFCSSLPDYLPLSNLFKSIYPSVTMKKPGFLAASVAAVSATAVSASSSSFTCSSNFQFSRPVSPVLGCCADFLCSRGWFPRRFLF